VLTGEDAAYAGVTPLHPFDPRKYQWGALQLVARYAELDVDSQAFKDGFADPKTYASSANAWSVGLNWFLNKNIRANLSFSRTTFDGYTGGTPKSGKFITAAQPENVLFSRVQLSF
jgi:phosphate-selective porin OprO/OprP